MRLLLAVGLAAPVLAATYYVKPTGDNSAPGTSVAQAWRTIARVNQSTLNPGDAVCFEGGWKYPGNLLLQRSGALGAPIVIGSYNASYGPRAEILAGAGKGIHVLNAQHLRIENLRITGSGATINQESGITLENTVADPRSGIEIRNVEVSGFRQAGIDLGRYLAYYPNGAVAGFRDVRITGVDSHHNGYAGMWTGQCRAVDQNRYCHSNIVIAWSKFRENEGLVIPEQTGNGLVLRDVADALVEHCQFFRNGRYSQTVNGPVGIYAVWSTRVTIQSNESWDNQTSNGDGGGFDLDGGTTDSWLQYNYSHGNAGAGFLVWQFPDTFRRSARLVVRYNISQNDARKGTVHGAIHIGAEDSLAEVDVYNNTVWTSGEGLISGTAPAFKAEGILSGIRVRDNIFRGTDRTGLILVNSVKGGLQLAGNVYWQGGSPLSILWLSTRYTSLQAWRNATLQERYGGDDVGFEVAPRLTSPGNGGTIGDEPLSSLTEYKLQPTSPLLGQALAVAPAPRDFYGTALPPGARDVGAHER